MQIPNWTLKTSGFACLLFLIPSLKLLSSALPLTVLTSLQFLLAVAALSSPLPLSELLFAGTELYLAPAAIWRVRAKIEAQSFRMPSL